MGHILELSKDLQDHNFTPNYWLIHKQSFMLDSLFYIFPLIKFPAFVFAFTTLLNKAYSLPSKKKNDKAYWKKTQMQKMRWENKRPMKHPEL
uniref:Uncharacterized protein n=1 Tax=Rhizophora mucronata TaxID=61149 RepID=A0A2P2NVE9_RHIMU